MNVFDNGGFIGRSANYTDITPYLTSTTATITYVNGSVTGFNGSTTVGVTVSLTSLGLQYGDMVIVAYEATGVTDKNLEINGYTTIAEVYANRSRDSNLLVAYKFMGTQPDLEIIIPPTGSTDEAGAVAIQAYRGVNLDTPLDVTTTTQGFGSTVIPTPPDITPVTTGAKIIIVGSGSHSRGDSVVYEASYLSNFLSISHNASNTDAIIGIGHVDWSGGTYDPARFTFTGFDNTSNFSSNAVTMALKPGFLFGNKKNSGIWNVKAQKDSKTPGVGILELKG